MNTSTPIAYSIRIEPDLDALTFEGSVEIDIRPGDPKGIVSLDSVELEILDCVELSPEGNIPREHSVGPDSVDIVLPDTGAEKRTVRLSFRGRLNRDLRGLYSAAYVHDGETRHLAVTQFEEIDARRAFPCFDHPRHNTPFTIELVAGEGDTAIATTAVERVIPLEDGRQVFMFGRTPPMPTYLLFFGVGDFDFLEDTDFRVPIRIAATPGKAKYGARAIEYARKSIEFCETFTGVDYLVDKLDLIAAPEFAYGAMENIGAISYRENLLLYYPDFVGRRGLERIASVTAHEVAHMWFGDLTSPRDWKYVWLNEAFATYVQSLIIESAYPTWRPVDQFLQSAASSAMGRDSLIDTVAIEFPEEGHTEIDPSTAPIIYSKAGLLLRMIHRWLGDDTFTGGVRRYLSAFSFQSTDTDGFLREFSAGASAGASAGTGAGAGQTKDVAAMVENWIRQPGFPLVRVKREGNRLSLEQERFTYLEHVTDQLWRIPVSMQVILDNGGCETVELMLDGKTASIELPSNALAVKLNADQTGLYRVSYNADILSALGSIIAEGGLSGRDTYGIVADLTALVVKGEIGLSYFLDFLLENFGNMSEYIVVSTVAHSLLSLWRLSPDQRDTVAYAGRRLLLPVFKGIGITPVPDEPYDSMLLRDDLVWPLYLFGSSEIGVELSNRFEALETGEEIEPDLMLDVIRAGARQGASIEWFKGKAEDSETPAEMKNHIYQAIGWFEDPETLSQVLGYTMKSVKPQNRAFVFRSLASNPSADSLLWTWLRESFDDVRGMHIYFRSVILSEVIPVCEVSSESELSSFLDRYVEEDPEAPIGVINMAREKRRVYNRLMKRNRDGGMS